MLETRPDKERSILSALWLGVFIVCKSIIAVYCIAGSFALKVPKDITFMLLTGIFSLIDIISLMAIWNWWKWGFYVLGIGTTGIITIALFGGLPLPFLWVTGMLGSFVVTISIMYPNWFNFE